MTKNLIVVALAALATLALPVLAAEAKRPAGAEKAAAKQGTKSQRCKKPRSVGFIVRGSLAAHDQASVELAATSSNRHAARWLEQNTSAFDTTGLTLTFAGVTDADASGSIDLADVVATDVVRVKGKLSLPKAGCAGDSALTVKKFSITRATSEEIAE
jgi:hypothetical protein